MRKLLLVGLVIFGLVALGGCGGGSLFSETSFEELNGTRTLRSGSGEVLFLGSTQRYALSFVEGFLNITVASVTPDNTQATCYIQQFLRWEAIDTDGTVLFPVDVIYPKTFQVTVRREGDDEFSYVWERETGEGTESGNGRVELYKGKSARETGIIINEDVDYGEGYDFKKGLAYDVTYSTSK